MNPHDVTITWNDGSKEVVRVYAYPRIRDGALMLVITRTEARYIPLTSIREYAVDSL